MVGRVVRGVMFIDLYHAVLEMLFGSCAISSGLGIGRVRRGVMFIDFYHAVPEMLARILGDFVRPGGPQGRARGSVVCWHCIIDCAWFSVRIRVLLCGVLFFVFFFVVFSIYF